MEQPFDKCSAVLHNNLVCFLICGEITNFISDTGGKHDILFVVSESEL